MQSDTPHRPTPLEALLDRAGRTPEAVALIMGGEPWTCARLAAESARLAGAFRACGVRAGDRVALHMGNLSELALAFLACWRTGAIAVPMNTRYKPPELAERFARVRPALYLGQDALYPGVRDIPAEVLAPDARYVVGSTAPRDEARPWTALMAAGAVQDPHRALEPPPVDRDAPAVLLNTSGTTGRSKLVVWTQRMMATFVDSARSRGAGPHDVRAISTPMMHASGGWSLACCLLTGTVAILLERFDPDAVLDTIAAYRCTSFGGLPFMHAELVRHQRMQPRDVASMRCCISGGDVCPAETEQAFADVFPCPLLSFWSATEEIAASHPGSRPGPFVRLVPSAEVRLVDTGGAPVAEGEAGEMLIRSPSTTPGYWLGPGRIDPLPGGWFHSGDLMRREPDGQLRYLGRLKDLIVRGGGNISPVEVEEALRRQPGVTDAAVAGLPDPELGQRVGAALVLAPGTTVASVPDILAGVRAELADIKVPEVTAIVDAIPRNALTKVDRNAVAAVLSIENARA